MRRAGAAAIAVIAWAPAFAQSDADFDKRCARWIEKHGYTRDYIEMRTGIRPPARARWKDNIGRDEVRAGDVVLLTLWPGHLALVEAVERDDAKQPIRLSVAGFNYGLGKPMIDRECEVSGNFGVETREVVTPADIGGYWRPPPR